MTRIDRDAGFVLQRRELGESDLLLVFFGLKLGLQPILAKGARASKRRFAGRLEPFQRVRVLLRWSRGTWPTLAEAEVEAINLERLRSYEAMRVAGEVSAWLRQVLPEGQAEPEVFSELEGFFASSLTSEWCATYFQMRALHALGVTPILDACVVSGHPCPEDKPAYFDPVRAGVVSRAYGGGPILLTAEERQAWRSAIESPSFSPSEGEHLDGLTRAVRAMAEQYGGRRGGGVLSGPSGRV